MSAAPEVETAPEACPNCGSRSVGRYCSSCGQKADPVAPTLGYFMREIVGELLNVDGKIFRSLRLLLTRPGFLTRELFAGRRASYVSPIRLYLTASIIMFALAAFGTFDGNVEFTADPGEAVDAAEGRNEIMAELNARLPQVMFVLVPLFAALIMLLRRGSGHTYPQHLYFALHVHAAWFFANSVDSLFEAMGPVPYLTAGVDSATELYMVVYLVAAFWRTYGTTFFGALWRALIAGVLYLAAIIGTFMAIALPVIFNQGP
jgi:hypothetical protein